MIYELSLSAKITIKLYNSSWVQGNLTFYFVSMQIYYLGYIEYSLMHVRWVGISIYALFWKEFSEDLCIYTTISELHWHFDKVGLNNLINYSRLHFVRFDMQQFQIFTYTVFKSQTTTVRNYIDSGNLNI